MKKLFFLFAFFAAVATVSCTRDDVRGGVAPVSEGEPITLRVGVSTLGTRADDETIVDSSDSTVESSDSEKKINSLQVFVFSAGEGGGLEKCAYVENASSVALTCFAGDKEVVAVVNATKEIDWLTIDSAEDLNSEKTLLEDNSDGNFFMYGSVPTEVLADGSNSPIEIEVERRVAKVVLKSVKNEVTSESSVGGLVLKSAYLINVAGDSDYGCSADCEHLVWYNQSARDESLSSDLNGLLYSWLGDYEISGEGLYEVGQTFYCYPNSTDQPTRLVVEATLNNRTWYYPVTIENVVPNCLYEVELTITGAGAPSADSDPQIADFKFNVTVADWTYRSIIQKI